MKREGRAEQGYQVCCYSGKGMGIVLQDKAGPDIGRTEDER